MLPSMPVPLVPWEIPYFLSLPPFYCKLLQIQNLQLHLYVKLVVYVLFEGKLGTGVVVLFVCEHSRLELFHGCGVELEACFCLGMEGSGMHGDSYTPPFLFYSPLYTDLQGLSQNLSRWIWCFQQDGVLLSSSALQKGSTRAGPGNEDVVLQWTAAGGNGRVLSSTAATAATD